MHHLGEGDLLGREDAIRIGALRWHEAVSRKEEGARNAIKLLSLVLPGSAKVALEMCVLLETRIGIGRQHLAVRVYADACTLGLLEQELKVMEVVPSHDDKGTLLDGERDLSRLRGTVGSSVCLIEHRHDRIVDLTYLEHERQQRIDAARFAEGGERVYEELLHSLVRATKYAGMEGIGGHAPQAKEDERLE